MAPTLVASYFLQQNTTAATALTTPSFTPSNGEVVIVKLATWDTGTAMGAPTGGSQTYTSRIIVAPGGFRPWNGIYTAVISGSPGSMTVSSTPGASARYSMTVERWSSATLAVTPVTNSGGTTNGGAGAASSTLTTSAANSVISWVAGDSQSLDPATRAYLNSATDEGVRDGHVGSNGVDYHAWQNVAAAGSTSFGLSAPTGMQWDIAGIEVLDAGGAAAPAFPPNQQVRRRLSAAPRQPRDSARIATPVRAQADPPFPFIGIKQSRRLRGLLARRGEMFTPVPPQVVVAAPAFPPRPVRARLKGLRLSRGEMFAPPADQLGAGRQSQRPRLRLPRIFRGRAAAPVPAQIVLTAPAYPPQSVRSRLRGLRLFRGRAAAPTPDQVIVAPPAYPIQSVRTRLKGLRMFRSRVAAPVPPQILVAPPAFVPFAIRARLKGLLTKRPRSGTPPVGQPAPAAPTHVHPRGIAPRRGHAVMPPPPQGTVSPPAGPTVRARLKGLRPPRGREASTPVPAQVVVVPPAYPPGLSRAKKRVARILRGVARFVPFTDATPVVQPRTPTVTVDLARSTATVDLSRTTATADLTRPSVTVAL